MIRLRIKFIGICLVLSVLPSIVNSQSPRLVIPEGHAHVIVASQFSPDGKSILTVSDDGTAKLWDFETAKLIRTIEETPREPFNNGMFSPDGSIIILLSKGGTLTAWGKSTGKKLGSWKATDTQNVDDMFLMNGKRYSEIWERVAQPYDLARVVKFSSDNKKMLIDSQSGHDILWSIANGSQTELGQHDQITWGSDDKMLISFTSLPDSYILTTLDVSTGRPTSTRKFSNEGFLSPDGKMFLTKKKLYLVNDERKEIALPDDPFSYFFSPRGNYVMTYSGNVFQSQTGKLLYSVKVPPTGAWSSAILVSPSEKWLAVSSMNELKIFEMATGKLIHSFGTLGMDFRMEWGTGDSTLMRTARIYDFFENSLQVRDQYTNEFVSTRTYRTEVWDIQSAKRMLEIDGHSPIISLNSKYILNPVRGQSSTDFSEELEVISLYKPKTKIRLEGITKFPSGFQKINGKANVILTRFSSKLKAYDLSSGQFLFETSNYLNGNHISADGKNLLVGDKRTLRVLNARTGQEQLVLKVDSTEFVSAAWNQEGNRIFAAAADAIFVWDKDTGSLIQMIPGDFLNTSSFISSRNGKWLLVIQRSSYSVLIDLAAGVIVPLEAKSVIYLDNASFSDDSEILLTSSSHESMGSVWFLNERTIVPISFYEMSELALTADNKLLAVSEWDRMTISSLSTLKKKKQQFFSLGTGDARTIKFTPDGKFLAATYGYDSITTSMWNLQTKTEVVFPEELLEISPDGRFLLLQSAAKSTILREFPSGKISREFTEGELQGVDWESGKILFFSNPRFILEDIEKEANKISWMLLDSADWVIIHPDGLFDASQGAMSKLYFVQGSEIIEFGQLKERYYEPGLWRKISSGEELRKTTGLKAIDLPPECQLGPLENGYLPIKVINKGGGIGPISVFVNGKEVIADAREKDADPAASVIQLKIYLANNKNIIKGAENFISVKAWNAGRWVVSRGKLVSYYSNEVEKHTPAIHILACGISDYEGNEIDLKYAAKDAEDMSKAIELGAKKLFGVDKSFVYLLTTNKSKEFYPTKANIVKTINDIAAVAHPLDVFVMYISGHGANLGGPDGDWHYLTRDAYTNSSTAYADPAIRQQTTLSSDELVELLKSVAALKEVLIIDACASGKVVENLMTQREVSANTLRALDRMKDRIGLHVITGCTADAVSYEASKYGQGVLTYSLLEGIRGAALREEQYVDIDKLFQYAHERVPVLAEGIGGIQSPQIFSPNGSQSFDIGLLTESEKMKVPVAAIKPVYIRSNFQDDDELEDILGLNKIVDDALTDAAAKGSGAQVIFVDVKEYPEACKLSGRYQSIGKKIILKLKRRCGQVTSSHEIVADSIQALALEIVKLL